MASFQTSPAVTQESLLYDFYQDQAAYNRVLMDNYPSHHNHQHSSNNMDSPIGLGGSAPVRMKKRQQAVRACTHCKRLHAKCSNERPCKRCENNGLAETCIDSPRKPRMGKALKAGPSPNGTMPAQQEKVKQTSIFADPGGLVLTHLDRHGAHLPEFKSSFVLPPPTSQLHNNEEMIVTYPRQTITNPVFKTEKLAPFVPNQMKNYVGIDNSSMALKKMMYEKDNFTEWKPILSFYNQATEGRTSPSLVDSPLQSPYSECK